MTRPRATVSPGDALGSTIADTKSRVVALENVAHSHATPVSALMPVGTIVDYVGTVAPAGWLILDGTTVANGQTLYPDLWAVLPATFKSGANIVLPNTKGRVSVGRDPADTDFDAIGDTGGAKTVSLTTAEMPSHTHTQNAHTHALGPGQDFGTFFGGNPGGFATFALQVQAINQATYQGPYSATATTATNQNTGGGGAHQNLQPFITFSKIIKAV